MSISIVKLGSARRKNEGLRIGTVRRPPRGVPKAEFAKRDFYDAWLPQLAPSQALVSRAMRGLDERGWARFVRQYRREMARPETARLLDVLAALSQHTNFAVGCYCEDESRCHRSVLEAMLAERGAAIA